MFTNQLRFTGFSGIDTTEMVQQIMRAESVRLDRLRQQRDLMQWQQELYHQVAGRLQQFNRTWFQSGTNSILNSSRWNIMTPTITSGGNASTGITINPRPNATAGNHNIQVYQLAQNARFRSTGNLNPGARATGGFYFGYNDDREFEDDGTYTFIVRLEGGANQAINLEGAMINAVKNGLANADQNLVDEINEQLEARLGIDAINGQPRARANLEGNGDIVFRTNEGNRLEILGSGGPHGLSLQELGFNPPTGTAIMSSSLNLNSPVGEHLGMAAGDSGSFDIIIGSTTHTIEFDYDDSIQAVMDRVNALPSVTMNFHALSGQFILQGANGALNDIQLYDNGSGFLTHIFGANYNTDAREQSGGDAIFRLNGMLTSRDSNSFDIDGMNIILNHNALEGANIVRDAVTGLIDFANSTAAEFNINLAQNVDNVVNMIQEFIEAYNELVASITSLSETRRPRTQGGFFMPLTDEQRRAMSDREIEMWEEQARTGILNRDDVLRGILADLRNHVFAPITLPDGREFSLLHIGIRTSQDLSEWGLLQIGNDADIDNFATLRYNLQNHFDDVFHLFTNLDTSVPVTNRPERLTRNGIFMRIQDLFTWQTSVGGGLRERAGIEGNDASMIDNHMTNRIQEQERRIDNMIRVLERREQSLFARFSRMEVALMQSQNQMAFLDQIIWGGQ